MEIDLTKYASLKTKAAKIRAMKKDGHQQSDIAKVLKISQQHVSATLRRDLKRRNGNNTYRKLLPAMRQEVRDALANKLQADPRLPPNTVVYVGETGEIRFFEMRQHSKRGWIIEPIPALRIAGILGELK